MVISIVSLEFIGVWDTDCIAIGHITDAIERDGLFLIKIILKFLNIILPTAADILNYFRFH